MNSPVLLRFQHFRRRSVLREKNCGFGFLNKSITLPVFVNTKCRENVAAAKRKILSVSEHINQMRVSCLSVAVDGVNGHLADGVGQDTSRLQVRVWCHVRGLHSPLPPPRAQVNV